MNHTKIGSRNRFEDWPQRLADYIASREPLPFAWGSNDCGHFVCGTIAAMTGVDPSAGWPAYHDARGARLAMGPLLRAAARVAAQRGLPEVPPRFARRGDVALYFGRDGATLGIVALDGAHVLTPSPVGLRRVPLAEAKRAWRV